MPTGPAKPTSAPVTFSISAASAGCTEDYISEQVAKYHCKGVRHIFPVHLYNNKYSGAALYNDFWTIANFIVTGGFIDLIRPRDGEPEARLHPRRVDVDLEQFHVA